MKNLYYLVWAGAITNFKKYNPQKEWKNHLFFLVSFIMSLNLATLNLWFKFLDITFITSLQIDFLEGTKLNDFIEYCATYCLPFAILNYFLIFYNNRYEKLIRQYPNVERKVSFGYMMISLVIFAISIFLSIWLIPNNR